MKQVIRYFSTTFLVLIMLVAVFMLLTPHLGWQIDVALGNSMSPTLKAGGMVITQPVDPSDIKVGDIITYGSPLDDKLVTHRVVEIEEHSPPLFRTKGDVNEDPNPYLVPPQNIVGKVGFNIPLLGYMTQFVKTPLGLILILLIPGLIIIAVEMRNIWQVFIEQHIESNSSPVANINQVTLGGQVLTAIENADGVVVGSAGSYHNNIWFGYLNETGIGNMIGNVLSITWDTSPTRSPIMVQAATYQNVDQTTPIADSASNTNTSAGSIQAGSVSVGSDDRLVYVSVSGQPSDHTAPIGYTEQIEQDGPANAHSNASVQRDATTSSTENPTATWSGTNRLAIFSAVLNAAVSGSSYISPGTIASQVLDTGGAGARWDALFWDETLPSNTHITFEVRASDTAFLKDAATPSWTSVGGTSPVTSGLPSG